jgi:hypothetical protein
MALRLGGRVLVTARFLARLSFAAIVLEARPCRHSLRGFAFIGSTSLLRPHCLNQLSDLWIGDFQKPEC